VSQCGFKSPTPMAYHPASPSQDASSKYDSSWVSTISASPMDSELTVFVDSMQTPYVHASSRNGCSVPVIPWCTNATIPWCPDEYAFPTQPSPPRVPPTFPSHGSPRYAQPNRHANFRSSRWLPRFACRYGSASERGCPCQHPGAARWCHVA